MSNRGAVDPSRLIPTGDGLYVLPQSNPGHAPRYDLGEGARYNADGTIHYDPNGIWNTKLGKIGLLATIAAGGAAGGALASGAFGGGAAAGGTAAMPATTAGIPGTVLPGAAIGAPTATGALGAGSVVGIGGGSQVGTAGTLSTLAKLAKYYQMAGDVGSVLGKQQQGAAQGKIAQADLQQRQDQNALASYIAQQNTQNAAANTDLQRKSFELQNRSATAKQALIGALLGGGITPTSISGGQASGGLLRSLNGNSDALAAMKLLGQQGALAQATPVVFQGGQIMEAPKMSTLPQVDNGGFLSTLAHIAELAGAASPYIKPKTPSQGQPMDERYGTPGGFF